ncbi:hypothetical protein ACIBCM_33015 [Streptomyces sp. NPDC051018]|uniref:hypothetical protein n=1 Tax=Streptomyces sp. NPDC051018 TaxID=3365639 RepID=UPI003799BA79
MSFEAEWAQAKADAAMRLNRVPDEPGVPRGPGGGSGDLLVRGDDLGLIGRAAYRLRGGLASAGKHAAEATRGAAGELGGGRFTTGPALTGLAGAWDNQVKALLEACAHISNHLDFTTKVHGEDERRIETSMRNTEKLPMTASRLSEYFH